MAWRGVITAILLVSAGIAGAADARSHSPAVLRAGVFLQPPFVMLDDHGNYGGMAVDLWRMSTQDLGVGTVYVPFTSWGDLLDAVGSGLIDVAVGDVTVSSRRAEYMHFSFPWYDGGMRILKKSETQSFWKELVKSQRFRIYGLFCLLFLVLACLMTWFRRRKDPEFPKDLKSGYTLSLLDITSSVRCGEINQEYLGWKGHILSAVWMMFGLGMVAYVTSTMTTAMTTVKLDKDGIYELGDLPGKKIAALRGGLSARYLRELHLDVVGCRNLKEAVDKLRDGKVRAVVSDAPILEHFVHSRPDEKMEVAGAVFHPDKYAFAAHPSQARMMDKVTVELIRLVEQGEVEKLKRKYMGEGHGYLSFE